MKKEYTLNEHNILNELKQFPFMNPQIEHLNSDFNTELIIRYAGENIFLQILAILYQNLNGKLLYIRIYIRILIYLNFFDKLNSYHKICFCIMKIKMKSPQVVSKFLKI